jgi:hypothetical protein
VLQQFSVSQKKMRAELNFPAEGHGAVHFRKMTAYVHEYLRAMNSVLMGAQMSMLRNDFAWVRAKDFVT